MHDPNSSCLFHRASIIVPVPERVWGKIDMYENRGQSDKNDKCDKRLHPWFIMVGIYSPMP